MENKNQNLQTQTQNTKKHTPIDNNQFFDMVKYLNKHLLLDNLNEYLNNNNCNNIIMDTKALILFKKFIREETKADSETDFLLTDWCPCVTSAQ